MKQPDPTDWGTYDHPSPIPARRKLLAHLRKLARDGKVCPTDRSLAAALGISTDHVSKCMAELRDGNRISVENVGSRRIVTLIAEGLATADPRPEPEPFVFKPRVREITQAAADIFGVPVRDILSKSRFREHTSARQAVCLVAWERGWSSPAIGRVLGRDHSTVLHGRDRAAALGAGDPGYAAKVAELLERSPVRVVAG